MCARLAPVAHRWSSLPAPRPGCLAPPGRHLRQPVRRRALPPQPAALGVLHRLELPPELLRLDEPCSLLRPVPFALARLLALRLGPLSLCFDPLPLSPLPVSVGFSRLRAAAQLGGQLIRPVVRADFRAEVRPDAARRPLEPGCELCPGCRLGIAPANEGDGRAFASLRQIDQRERRPPRRSSNDPASPLPSRPPGRRPEFRPVTGRSK